jgi:hypothetical protein
MYVYTYVPTYIQVHIYSNMQPTEDIPTYYSEQYMYIHVHTYVLVVVVLQVHCMYVRIKKLAARAAMRCVFPSFLPCFLPTRLYSMHKYSTDIVGTSYSAVQKTCEEVITLDLRPSPPFPRLLFKKERNKRGKRKRKKKKTKIKVEENWKKIGRKGPGIEG